MRFNTETINFFWTVSVKLGRKKIGDLACFWGKTSKPVVVPFFDEYEHSFSSFYTQITNGYPHYGRPSFAEYHTKKI